MPTLASLAAEINAEFTNTESSRLRTGRLLLQAREVFDADKAPGDSWRAWCATNIQRSYRDCKRVMALARSPNPVAAVQAERDKASKGMARTRAASKSAGGTNVSPSPTPKTGMPKTKTTTPTPTTANTRVASYNVSPYGNVVPVRLNDAAAKIFFVEIRDGNKYHPLIDDCYPNRAEAEAARLQVLRGETPTPSTWSETENETPEPSAPQDGAHGAPEAQPEPSQPASPPSAAKIAETVELEAEAETEAVPAWRIAYEDDTMEDFNDADYETDTTDVTAELDALGAPPPDDQPAELPKFSPGREIEQFSNIIAKIVDPAAPEPEAVTGLRLLRQRPDARDIWEKLRSPTKLLDVNQYYDMTNHFYIGHMKTIAYLQEKIKIYEKMRQKPPKFDDMKKTVEHAQHVVRRMRGMVENLLTNGVPRTRDQLDEVVRRCSLSHAKQFREWLNIAWSQIETNAKDDPEIVLLRARVEALVTENRALNSENHKLRMASTLLPKMPPPPHVQTS